MQEGELTSGFFGSDFKGYNLKFAELKIELTKTVRNILKEMGFVCHAEHPRKFISNYPATLGTPQQLRQEAWNLANDSLRVTLYLFQWCGCGMWGCICCSS